MIRLITCWLEGLVIEYACFPPAFPNDEPLRKRSDCPAATGGDDSTLDRDDHAEQGMAAEVLRRPVQSTMA